MRLLLCSLAVLVVCSLPQPAPAQVRTSDLISADVAHRFGMKKAWDTHIQVSRGSGRVVHLTQFVSRRQNHAVYDIIDGEKTYRYSERDRDTFGDLLGRERAKDLAIDKYNELLQQGKTPRAQEHIVPAVFLYATTNRSIVHVIDGETGRTVWAQQVGNPSFPTTAVAADDDRVAVCNGSTIYMLDAKTGQLLWERMAMGAVSAGPALTPEIVTVPMLSGVMESYKVGPNYRETPTIYRSQGAIYVQPIATPRSIAWTTMRGHMYVANNTNGQPRFRLEASDTIIGGVSFLAPRYLYTASFDGYVYCVDETTGDQLWRYQTGGTIKQTPVAIDGTVFIITDSSELHALDALTGNLKTIEPAAPASGSAAAAASAPAARGTWPVVSGIRGIISASPTKLYCLGRPGELIILDIHGGRRLGTLSIGDQDLLMPNYQTDRLILGTSTGLLQCLHERQLGWPYGPVVHEAVWAKKLGITLEVPPDPQKPAPPATQSAPVTPPPPVTDAMPPVDVMEADPFGGQPAPQPEAPQPEAPLPQNPPANQAEAEDPFG